MKIKVLLNFAKLTVALLVAFARNHVAKMTGNTNFTTPDVQLAQITTATNNLETAELAANKGGKLQTENLKIAKKALVDLLYTQAAYIDRIAKGNSAIITSSGFNHNSEIRKPAEHPIFDVKLSIKPGELVVALKSVENSGAYIWQYCKGDIPQSDENAWVFAGATTKAKHVISNLTSGSRYWLRGCAVTPEGMTVWSEPMSRIVA